MTKTRGLGLALVSMCGLALSACGGGDDGGLSFRAADVNGSSAIMATGGSPPDVSAAQAKSQQLAILYGANIGHRSASIEVDWEGNFRGGFAEEGGRHSVECDPITCDYGSITFTPIMIKNGVRLATSREIEVYGNGGVETTLGYGGWMDHSLFVVFVATETYDGGSFVNWVSGISRALGDAPETNPSTGTFAWNGIMVGRNSNLESTGVSNVVQGDADISAELSSSGNMSVDVEFSNIKDLNSGVSIVDMTWTNISVVNGSFDGGTIEGSFYGPQHEEVAGVFERNYVLGAFGARR